MRIPAIGPVHTAWLLLLTQACAAVGQDPFPGTDPDHSPFIVELLRQDIEYDAVDFESAAGVNSSSRGLDKRRNGVLFGFGNDALRGYGMVFQENLKYVSTTNETMRGDGLLGLGVGVMGAPGFRRLDGDFRLLVPYRAGLNLGVGELEVENAPSFATSNGDEYFTGDLEGEVGFGVEWKGLRLATGLYGSLYILNADDNDKTDLDGVNIGPYADIRFKDNEYPVYISGRIMGGDVKQGFIVSVGTSL